MKTSSQKEVSDKQQFLISEHRVVASRLDIKYGVLGIQINLID